MSARTGRIQTARHFHRERENLYIPPDALFLRSLCSTIENRADFVVLPSENGSYIGVKENSKLRRISTVQSKGRAKFHAVAQVPDKVAAFGALARRHGAAAPAQGSICRAASQGAGSARRSPENVGDGARVVRLFEFCLMANTFETPNPTASINRKV